MDINVLNSNGSIKDGWSGFWTGPNLNGGSSSIGIKVQNGFVNLSFLLKSVEGDSWPITQEIKVDWEHCHFGGGRPFIACPRSGCAKRVVKLYGAQGLFLCRTCSGITYQSQRENELDRAYRRMNKLRAKAGAEPGLASAYRGRPKGRWRRTHRRLVAEAEVVERELLGRLSSRL